MAKISKRDPRSANVQIYLNIVETANLFLQSRKASNYSYHTIKFYDDKVPVILKWFNSQCFETWDEITPQVIRDFLESMRDNGHNQGGVFLYYRVVRALMRWVWDEYDIEVRNPINKVKCQDRKPVPIQGITIEEVNQMMDACKFNKFPERDKALIAVLVDTGIRRSELMSLLMSDVDLDSGRIIVQQGKGGKTRHVFFGRDTKKLLRKYLSRIEDARPNDPFWLTNEGDPLSIDGARSVLRRTQRAAGLTKIHDFHDFRRCFAIERKRNGDDDITISRALGHSSLEVTKRYLAFTEDDDRSFALRASPMDNRKKRKGRT